MCSILRYNFRWKPFSFSYVFKEFSEPWSAVGIATWLWNWQPRNYGSIPAWCKRFSLLQNTHTGYGAHSAVPGALFPGLKQPARKVNHLSPPSAVVKNAWSYKRTAMPSSAFMAWRGTNLNPRSRCEQKQLSYLNKNWHNSTNFYNIIQCEISRKFIRRFSCCYTNTNRRTAVF